MNALARWRAFISVVESLSFILARPEFSERIENYIRFVRRRWKRRDGLWKKKNAFITFPGVRAPVRVRVCV